MWPYTDDTVMAMSIVESLHHHGRIDQDWLAKRFSRKYQLDPTRGYARTALVVLSEIARGRDWRQAALSAFGGKGLMGNGGAMRAAPIGAYFAGDLVAAAAEARLSAEVTHAHLEGQAGAGLRVLAQDTVPFALWCVCHHGEITRGRCGPQPPASATATPWVPSWGDRGAASRRSGIPEEWRQHREPLSAMLRLELD